MLRKAHVALTITLALGMVVLIVAMFGLVRGRAVAQDRAMAEREMAMVERERAAAVTEFLEAMLVAAEPDSTSAPGVPEILDRAATRLDDVSDEEVAERLREVIERARRDAAGSDSGG